MADIAANGVRSVHRALRLLTFLGPDRKFGTLSEFTRHAGLATSTVQRLLQTLESEQFLKRLPDGRYTYGRTLSYLGIWANRAEDFYQTVCPYLESLSAESGETANLGVWDENNQVVYVRQSLSARSIRHVSWLGRPFPPKHTSMGMALDGKCNEFGFVSVNAGQWEPEVTGIASPIYDDEQKIIAGLNITGPSFRISSSDLSTLAVLVVSAAHDLTLYRGGRWPHRFFEAQTGDS